MSVSNSAIIRNAYDAFAMGDIPSVFAVFDPSITRTFPATVRCQETILATIRSAPSSNAQCSFPTARSGNVLGEDDLVVGLVTVSAKRSGASASFPEVHVWRMRDGKAIEFREYQGDEQREDRFWS